MALMGIDFQSSILPKKIDTFLIIVQLDFFVSPTQEAVFLGGGVLLRI